MSAVADEAELGWDPLTDDETVGAGLVAGGVAWCFGIELCGLGVLLDAVQKIGGEDLAVPLVEKFESVILSVPRRFGSDEYSETVSWVEKIVCAEEFGGDVYEDGCMDGRHCSVTGGAECRSAGYFLALVNGRTEFSKFVVL